MKVHMYRGLVYVSEAPGTENAEFSAQMMNVSTSANYHHGHKRWRFPVDHASVKALKAMGATMPKDIEDWLAEQNKLVVKREKANELKERSPKAVRDMVDGWGVRFKSEPFEHQVVSVAYGLMLPACGLFLDTGCGKTFVAGTIMQALVDRKGFNRFLVVAPKSILNVGWGEDLDKFTWLDWINIADPPRRPEVLKCPRCGREFKTHITWRHIKTHLKKVIARDGEEKVKADFYSKYPDLLPPGKDDKRTRLLRALDGDSQVFLINPEGFKLVVQDLMDQDWDMMIVDESSMLKSPKSQITKATINFGASVQRRVCMTATPRPNNSMDFWGQMAFIDQCLGGNFYSFRHKYYYQGGDGFSWHPKHDEVDFKIRDIVFQRAIRYRLDDCVDLPGENYQDLEVELDGELKKHYADMSKRMMVQFEDGETVETSWMIVQMNKLAQITSGFVFDEEGNSRWLGDSPKVAATVEMAKRLIESEERSVVIWVRFQEEAKILGKMMEKYGVSTMHGGTRDHEASARAFKTGKNKVMIAHAASAKFGHTWVEHCNAAIFHSYDYSFENFYQAKRRIYRIGQKRPVTYFPVMAKGTVDEVIIDAVMRKQTASETVVDENVFSRLQFLADKARGRRPRRKR